MSKKEMIMKLQTFQILAILAILPFLTEGCIIVANGKTVRGSGSFVTEEREVSEFDKVHLKGSGNVFLNRGETQSLTIKTDDNIMPYIESDVSGKKLTVSHGKHHLRPTVFEVFITVKHLEGVAISGSGDVRSEDRFLANNFYAEISGSGDLDIEVEAGILASKISGSGSIHLSGKANDFSVSISGSGDINAFDVQANNVSVKISGSGKCKVTATESLEAKISGSGDVYYRGRPKINTKMSGSGSLISED
jgi:hypothetical protein